MKNLLLTLLLFMSGLAYSQNLIIDTFNCQGASSSFTQTQYIVPSSTLSCDSIIGTHLFWVNFPANPADSIQTWWDIYTTNITGSLNTISVMFPPYAFPQSGCYRYDLVLACPNGLLTILTSTYYVSTLGVEELSINKTITKITDIMGRECLPETNKILVYHYNDGSTKKVFLSGL
jgi:uncharacterized membrane protein YqaE (UPF0057 family)